MAEGDAADIRERLLAAATDLACVNLWSVESAPGRLRAAAAHLTDAVTDLRDATALNDELAAEEVSVPFAVLDNETDEDEILPHVSVWAAYRQLVVAAEFVHSASAVPAFAGEPAGWRPVADALGKALVDLACLEGRAQCFAASSQRPAVLTSEATLSADAPAPVVGPDPDHRVSSLPRSAAATTDGSSAAETAVARPADHSAPVPSVRTHVPRDRPAPARLH